MNEAVDTGLPPPDAAAAAHSAAVTHCIREAIDAAGGWIDFARYMELALYAPGLGYYSAGAAKLGEAGDFVTAPELSPLFGRCLASQCAQVLGELGGGEILEAGAGSGVLAAQVLTALERRDALPLRYLILEPGADLRARQQQLLADRCPHLCGRVEWLDRLPASLTGVVLGNEVLDALPVQRFAVRGGEVLAGGVARAGDALIAEERDADAALTRRVRHIEAYLGAALADGYRSELAPSLPATIASYADCLEAGAMLWFDYGYPRREYYAPERRTGTLTCHYRHRAHGDPLWLPGLQDITAWVDFTGVAEAAVAAGLAVAGFTTQAHFLLACDAGEHLAELGAAAGTPRRAAELAAGARRLLLPGEMGERFRVIGLGRGLPAPLGGFALRDFSAGL